MGSELIVVCTIKGYLRSRFFNVYFPLAKMLVISLNNNKKKSATQSKFRQDGDAKGFSMRMTEKRGESENNPAT